MGARSYSDLVRQPEGIATNILANRLSRMEAVGLIVQTQARQGARPGQYALTKKGAALLPVIQALARWGEEFLPERWLPPEHFYALTPADLLVEGTPD